MKHGTNGKIIMTSKIIRFANESKIIDFDTHYECNEIVGGFWMSDQLEHFAELVRADAIAEEREACAKVCDDLRGINWGPEQCATAIRSRSSEH
jgi:hypothetical protein